MGKSSRPHISHAPRATEFASTCTVQRADGSFCGAAVMRDLPASICPKHAARVFIHLREFVNDADRGDLAMRVVSSLEQDAASRYAMTPARGVLDSFVYYVRVGDHVKIGHTADLRRRMKAYPTGKLLAVEPGGLALERRRHDQFQDALDVGREWFRITDGLMDHVRSLAS